MHIQRWVWKRSPRPMRLVMMLSLLLGGTAALGIASAVPALAASTLCSGFTACTTGVYTDHGWSSVYTTTHAWGQYSGHNCTNYVAWYEQSVNSMSSTRPSWLGQGGAQVWYGDAASGGITESSTPVKGAVAWWGAFGWNGSSGHVGIVEKVVSSTDIWVSWDSYSAGPYKWVELTSSDANSSTAVGWPQGFIYLGGVGSGGGSPPPPPPPPLYIQHVYSADTSGNLDESYWPDANDSFTTTSIGTLPSAPTMTSAVASPGGNAHVFSVLSSGALYESYYVSGNPWATHQIASLGSGIVAISSTMATDSSNMHVYSVDSSGDVYETYWPDTSGGWTTHQIGTYSTGVVGLSAQQTSSQLHIYAATSSGSIYESYWPNSSGTWSSDLVTSSLGSGITAMSANLAPDLSSEHVYTVDSSGTLDETYWPNSSGGWTTHQVGSLGSGVIGISSILAPGSTSEHVYAATGSGDVDETYWPDTSGGWTTHQIASYGVTLTGITAQLDTAGDQIVYTADSTGDLSEVYYNPGQPWVSQQFASIGSSLVDINSALTAS